VRASAPASKSVGEVMDLRRVVRAAIVHIVDPLLTYGDGPIDHRVKRRDKRAPGKFSLTAALIFDPQGLLQ
jgi:hypothetical protein